MKFTELLLSWQQSYGRSFLPWRIDKNPYKVWVSEIMLQQTQVSKVVPYYKRFINTFPNVFSLSQSDLDNVLFLWSGLGYYKRAQNLHLSSKILVERHGGIFPEDYEALVQLPGVGKSTAGAILSIGMNKKFPILDANVRRILKRLYGFQNVIVSEKKLWQMSENCLPEKENFATFNESMMDFGSLICKNKSPKCEICPLSKNCLGRNQHAKYSENTKIAKKNIIKIQKYFLIIQHDNAVWLKYRQLENLWNKMYCFPEFENKQETISWANSNIRYKSLEEKEPFFHRVTKYNIKVHAIIVKINKTQELKSKFSHGLWYKEKSKRIGIPKPVSLILSKIFNKLK